MAQFTYLNNDVKTKLNEVSKKIVEVKKMDDQEIIKMGNVLTGSLKNFKAEQKEVVSVFDKLIGILMAEKERRGIEKLHENQLSLFDTATALENKAETTEK